MLTVSFITVGYLRYDWNKRNSDKSAQHAFYPMMVGRVDKGGLAPYTYNYTIRTGSYPQIIHEPSFNATGGKITCTDFEDANGKTYTDWIPAIKLY